VVAHGGIDGVDQDVVRISNIRPHCKPAKARRLDVFAFCGERCSVIVGHHDLGRGIVHKGRLATRIENMVYPLGRSSVRIEELGLYQAPEIEDTTDTGGLATLINIACCGVPLVSRGLLGFVEGWVQF